MTITSIRIWPRSSAITTNTGISQLTIANTNIAAAHQNIINFTTQNRQISTGPSKVQPKSTKTIDKKHKLCYNKSISLIEARSVVRSGFIRIDYGKLRVSGSTAYGWSSQPDADGSWARFLYFDTDYIDSSNDHNRWNAFPLRCLVR